MEIKAVVDGRIITSEGVFARIRLKGLPRGSYKFFDIQDDGELCVGDKVSINIVRKAKEPTEIDVLLPEGPDYYAPEDAGSDAPGVEG